MNARNANQEKLDALEELAAAMYLVDQEPDITPAMVAYLYAAKAALERFQRAIAVSRAPSDALIVDTRPSGWDIRTWPSD